MAYQALYRKFRPKEFSDVKGQDHIVKTLKNQILLDRIGHAYLFTGTRGTGKTTVAKIFAKAVNCENPREDGSPCGECAVCKAIEDGASMDVIEMDAASNNGIEDIRSIIEEVEYHPTIGKKKVYIIDEVHMLSRAAFNALLKTLEEPPSYVIFIMATTEVNKIPITILSRSQRYDFHRITIDTIASRLAVVMDQEKHEYEERALNYIAKVADGSMRDALSLLDQCLAFYPKDTLTFDNALSVLGAVDTEVFSSLFLGIRKGDVAAVVRKLEEIILSGKELPQFIIDFTWYLRNLLLLKSADHMEDVLDVSSENLAQLKEEATMVSEEVLIRYIRLLSDLSNKIRYATQKRPLVEIALIRMMKPQMDTDQEAIIDRLYRLEERLDSGDFAVSTQTVKGSDGAVPVKHEREKLPEAIPEDVQKASKLWPTIVSSAMPPMKNYLALAYVSVSQNHELMLIFDENDKQQATAYRQIDGRKDQIISLIGEHVGAEVPLLIKLNTSNMPREHKYQNVVEEFADKIGVPIEVEEF